MAALTSRILIYLQFEGLYEGDRINVSLELMWQDHCTDVSIADLFVTACERFEVYYVYAHAARSNARRSQEHRRCQAHKAPPTRLYHVIAGLRSGHRQV